MSQVRKLYRLIRNGLWSKVKYNHEKAGGVWSAFWTMLVAGGWAFDDNDLINLGKYLHKNNYIFHWPDECHYSQAVDIGNISFCRAYEKFSGRLPFVWENINYREGFGNLPYGMHRTQSKTKGRLIIGASFVWQGKEVTVTSFNDEKKSLIACQYIVTKEGEVCDKCGTCQSSDETKISKRFSITADDMAEKLKTIHKTNDGE